MPENRRTHKKPPHLLWWSMGCVMLNFAIDATVNRYGSHWSGLIIVTLWLLPLIPFAIWAFVNERFIVQRRWVASRFSDRPISFVVIVALFIVVGISQAKQIFSRYTSHSATSDGILKGVAKPGQNSTPTDNKSSTEAEMTLAIDKLGFGRGLRDEKGRSILHAGEATASVVATALPENSDILGKMKSFWASCRVFGQGPDILGKKFQPRSISSMHPCRRHAVLCGDQALETSPSATIRAQL